MTTGQEKIGRHKPRRQLSAQASIKHNPNDEWQLNNHFKSLSPVTIAAPSRSYVELSESPNRMEQQRTVCLEPTTPPALSTRHFSRIRAIASRNLLAWGLTLKNKPLSVTYATATVDMVSFEEIVQKSTTKQTGRAHTVPVDLEKKRSGAL